MPRSMVCVTIRTGRRQNLLPACLCLLHGADTLLLLKKQDVYDSMEIQKIRTDGCEKDIFNKNGKACRKYRIFYVL